MNRVIRKVSFLGGHFFFGLALLECIQNGEAISHRARASKERSCDDADVRACSRPLLLKRHPAVPAARSPRRRGEFRRDGGG